MATWIDGRSGEIGRTIGQIAIDDLEARQGELSHVGGTVFANDRRVVVGRTAQEEYTRSANKQHAHWANISQTQVRRLRDEFGAAEVWFLLVSLSLQRDFLRIWYMPYQIVAVNVIDASAPKADGSHDLKIEDRDGRWFLGDADVSEFYREISLTAAQRELVAGATRPEPRWRPAESSKPVAPAAPAWPLSVVIEAFGYRFELAGTATPV